MPKSKQRTSKKASASAARKALADLGLHVPDLELVLRNSLYVGTPVTVHEVDQTRNLSEFGASAARCFESDGLDVGGKAVTDGSGKFALSLSRFVCIGTLKTAEPVSFVATARSSKPAIMTFITVSTGEDLVIDVFSWDVDGNPAAGVDFSWRCWTQTPREAIE